MAATRHHSLHTPSTSRIVWSMFCMMPTGQGRGSLHRQTKMRTADLKVLRNGAKCWPRRHRRSETSSFPTRYQTNTVRIFVISCHRDHRTKTCYVSHTKPRSSLNLRAASILLPKYRKRILLLNERSWRHWKSMFLASRILGRYRFTPWRSVSLMKSETSIPCTAHRS